MTEAREGEEIPIPGHHQKPHYSNIALRCRSINSSIIVHCFQSKIFSESAFSNAL